MCTRYINIYIKYRRSWNYNIFRVKKKQHARYLDTLVIRSLTSYGIPYRTSIMLSLKAPYRFPTVWWSPNGYQVVCAERRPMVHCYYQTGRVRTHAQGTWPERGFCGLQHHQYFESRCVQYNPSSVVTRKVVNISLAQSSPLQRAYSSKMAYLLARK